MKKIFSILFALVLVLSFSLIPAASVAASPEPEIMGWWHPPGLVGEWHFDKVHTDPSTLVQTTPDSSGQGNTGTLMPLGFEPTSVPGKLRNALSFDGTDDYVSVADSSYLDITSQLTIEAWIYADVIDTYKSIVVKGDAYTEGKINYGLQIHAEVSPGTLRFFVYNGSYSWADSTSQVSAGAWHHVAVTVDTATDTVNFYIDGLPAGTSTAFTASLPVSTSTLEIGRHRHATGGPCQYFNGIIDEVRIWDTAHPPLYVDDDGAQYATPYTTITAALAVAFDDDTIIVHRGTYHEQVEVDKDVTIMGVGFPTVIGTSSGFVISADGATVQGFNIRADDTVVWVQASHVTLSWNKITGTGDGDGIQLLSTDGEPSHHNTVEWNTIGRAGTGIKIGNSGENTVQHNWITRCRDDGILAIDTTYDNLIMRNVMLGNGDGTTTFDAHDTSTGTGTAGTANTWTRNFCRTSEPPGLRWG